MQPYFDMVRPTYVENWPAGLFNHSIATVHFGLSLEEAAAVLAHNAIKQEEGPPPTVAQSELVDRLIQKIEFLGRQFPGGFFVRLGSRSPKDSWTGYEGGFCCLDGKRAIALLLDSERVYEDLSLALKNAYCPHLVVREWVRLEPWQEFRCFVKGGELVGVSQYFYHDFFPEIAENHDGIQWAVKLFLDRIRAHLPVADVVVDVFVKIRRRGPEREHEVRLLEINPLCAYTDPCLFNWSRDRFEEFEFRFLTERPGQRGRRAG